MKELKFVDVGEGITEGHVIKWLFKDGDSVKEDEPIVQIETDKAVVNAPAPISGTLKINAPEKTILKVGDVIAYIGEKGELENVTKIKVPQRQEEKGSAPIMKAEVFVPIKKEVLATPSVRKLARELNIDISQVTGTGPFGKILEGDLKSSLSKQPPKAQLAQPIPQVQQPSRPFTSKFEEKHKEEIERIPMTQTRKAIARNMEESWKIPRAVHMDILDATSLFNLVGKEKEMMQKQFNTKLTFLPIIIKAVVEALKENPTFNSSYDGERQEIIVKHYYNIGLAAETQDGLKVAVLKNVDKKSIVQIAKEIQQLSDKLNNKTISIDEMSDTTFTITNIGSLGGGYLSVPMINPPDVAILGIHLIKDAPVVKNGQITVGKILPFSISFDHRVVDGAEAVKFGNALIKYLEDPDFLEMLG